MKLNATTLETQRFGKPAIKMTVKLELSDDEKVLFDAHKEAQDMYIAVGKCLIGKEPEAFQADRVVRGMTEFFENESTRAEFEDSLRKGCVKLKQLLELLQRSRKDYSVEF